MGVRARQMLGHLTRLKVDRSQSLFNFVPQEKNFTVKLARLLEGHLSHGLSAVGTKDEVKRLDGRPNRGPCTSIVIHRKRCHFSALLLFWLF